MRYVKFILLFAVLFLSIGFACASDNSLNETLDVAESDETSLDESKITPVQQSNNLSNSEVLDASAQPVDTKIANNPAKESLKIVKNSNYAKKGDTYYMYLKTSDGKIVANKKLSIGFNGKTYVKTTDSKGKFGIAVTKTASSGMMNITFKGDKSYKAFSSSFKFYVVNVFSINIANTKLLTDGYLRIYFTGSKKFITNNTVKITIGGKVFKKKASEECFIIFKPKLKAKKYTVLVNIGKLSHSKTVKCVNGVVKNPLKTSVSMVNGAPDIDVMPSMFVMADGDAKYTLTKEQYLQVIKRDSYCLFLYGKMSKYVCFKSKAAPKIYHIIKRGKWNVIEQAINIKLVKKNGYNYWPASVTVNLKGKSLTYSEVRDIQNTGYTCGPTSASVCSQALKNYHSEYYFQKNARMDGGINIPDLKYVLDCNHFTTSYYYSVDSGVRQLAKGGVALVAFLPNHYVSVIDVSKDGKKILVSNSYGEYDVGGNSRIPTGWVSLSKFKAKFAGVGLVVKLNYNLSPKVKDIVKNYYASMGPNWARQNTQERIPNVPI
ncbi:hypothetical protein [uncultured Methanobrevibacter sp.]|uniref:hypothetical protein n=1 Tax=uncultured Methanobrevibacter sp. TaxID=253161 RepID=UPI0025DE7259|nr:hypothetical protein [uncultured Methanobrevibacter sp.]